MGLIDVTALLSDPDFFDSISLVHRVPTVNSKGENTLVSTSVSTIGVVEPASGKTMQRYPDGLMGEDVYEFWVKGNIATDGTGVYPDLIVFRSQNYAVKSVQDFTNWGAGWCSGIAVREKPTIA